jgi:hypothetical protein
MMKTYRLSLKPNKGGKKCTRWKDPNLGKLKIFQRGHIARGIRRNQVIEPSPPPLRETY